MPSSLTEVRSSTCGCFPSPTGVGVRYGQNSIWLEAFLGGLAPRDFRATAGTRPSRHACCPAALPAGRTPDWQPILSLRWAHAAYRVPSSLDIDALWCRTIQPALHRLRLLRPRLRSRLTLGRLTLPRNPQAFGGSGSHTSFATHSGIRSSERSTCPCDQASLRSQRSPTIPSLQGIHSFGGMLEPRYVVGASALDQ